MTDNNVKFFGRYLRSVRLEKGIALEEITAGTRIGWETLLRIEDEDHEKLPAEVFVKGFIRSYAKAVGADGDRAIQGYEESLAEFRTVAQHQSELMRSRHVFWPRLALGVVLLAVIVAASIYALSTGNAPHGEPPPVATRAAAPEIAASPSVDTAPPPPETTPPETAPAKTAPPEIAPPEAAAEATAPAETAAAKTAPAMAAPLAQDAPAPAARDIDAPAPEVLPAELRQRLIIDAIEETWLKVTTDDMRTAEYMLKPGDHLQLDAEKGFSLLIGNAGGVTMQANGQVVPILGRSGQVITMQVP